MSYRFLLGLLIAVCFALPMTPNAAGQERAKAAEQEKKAGKEKGRQRRKKRESPPLDPAMEAYLKAGAPGEYHARLTAQAGRWTVKSTFWTSPGQPPTVTKASSVVKVLLGGRYTQEIYKTNFMGMKYEGFGLVGYDNVKKKYFSTWMDNMSTSIMMSEGNLNDAGVLVMKGSHYDPVKKKTVHTKMTLRFGTDSHVAEMFEIEDDDSERKTMRHEYTRVRPKKKAAEKKRA